MSNEAAERELTQTAIQARLKSLDDANWEELRQALDRTVVLVDSMSAKIIEHNPTWDQIPTLLTDDEQRVFWAVLSWSKR